MDQNHQPVDKVYQKVKSIHPCLIYYDINWNLKPTSWSIDRHLNKYQAFH